MIQHPDPGGQSRWARPWRGALAEPADRIAPIDGLRGLAILAVVGYHLNLPGFAVGFIGVDMFFVISGYLIIGQILQRLDRGDFDLLEFWARRSLRILPPLFLMLLGVLLLAPLALATPKDWEYLALSGGFSAIFVSNIYFLFKQGYFDLNMVEKPLLHTWSLSVEEQFYLATPLILLALYRGARALGGGIGRWLGLAGVLLGGLSLAACLAYTASPPSRNPAFYLAPWRAWEFIAGSLAGWLVQGPARDWLARWGGGVGLAGLLLVLGILVWAPGRDWFPGYLALAPVLATLAMLVAGLGAPQSLVVRLLCLRPLLAIGLVSYGWYLWHWPLLSLARLRWFFFPDPFREWAAVLLALLIAVASYHWLEQPLQDWRRRIPLRAWAFNIFIGSLLGCLVMMGLVSGVGGLFFLQAGEHPSLRADPALLAIAPGIPRPAPVTAPVLGLLVGDSHADVLLATLARESAALGVAELARLDWRCPNLGRSVGICDALTGQLAHQEQRPDRELGFVVVARRWNGYEHRFDGEQGTGFYERTLRTELELLSANGKRRLLVLAPIPEFIFHAQHCLLRADHESLSWDLCAVSRQSVEARRGPALALLGRVLETIPNARLVDPLEPFCDRQWCRPHAGQAGLYTDDNHLGPFGADWLHARLRAEFDWAFTGE